MKVILSDIKTVVCILSLQKYGVGETILTNQSTCVEMSDLQTLNNVIEQITRMKEMNYSLVPYILNIDDTVESLEKIRDFFLDTEQNMSYNIGEG